MWVLTNKSLEEHPRRRQKTHVLGTNGRVKVTLRALLPLHDHQGVIHDRHVLEERLPLAPR